MLSVGNMLAADGLVVAIDKVFHRIVDDGAGVEVGDPRLAEVGLFFARQAADDGRWRLEPVPVGCQMRVGVKHGDPRCVALPYGAGMAQVFGEEHGAAGGALVRG